MALRLIEISLPEKDRPFVDGLLKDQAVLQVWQECLSGEQILLRILLSAEETEPLLDRLEKRFSGADGFRIILLPVEAAIPRPKPPEETPAAPSATSASAPERKPARISREELYARITDSSRLSTVYLVMVVLSTIVAAIGLLRDNMTIEIGAMVLAPLLGPNMALSLATTLGDGALARRALKATASGILVAFLISAGAGLLFPFPANSVEMISRTKVGLGDVGLALVSGAAGALAFTTGVPATLIGVTVAVALLPPLVTFGLSLGAGHSAMALGALLLLLANVICVNLAGVTTFVLQGIHPLSWWEADRAKRATRNAIALWAVLLGALVVVILFSRRT